MGSVFKKGYGQVGHIRSFVPTSTPVVALTTTATKETFALIVKHMQMTELHLVHLSPNQPNVRYSVVKVSREFDGAFQWLTAELCEKEAKLGSGACVLSVNYYVHTFIQTVPFRAPRT